MYTVQLIQRRDVGYNKSEQVKKPAVLPAGEQYWEVWINMKMEVIIGSAEEFEAAAPCPEGEATMANYKAYVKSLLEAAGAEGRDIVCMRSLPMSDRTSDNFARIGWVEQAVNEYQMEHDKPQLVRIVADNDKAVEQDQVVYNMYYATTKAERLNDGRWD